VTVPPGVGTTHLAIALGVNDVAAGYPALSLTLESLMGRLVRGPATRTGSSGLCKRVPSAGPPPFSRSGTNIGRLWAEVTPHREAPLVRRERWEEICRLSSRERASLAEDRAAFPLTRGSAEDVEAGLHSVIGQVEVHRVETYLDTSASTPAPPGAKGRVFTITDLRVHHLALPEALDFGRRGRNRGARRGAGGEGLATAKARFEFLASVPVDAVYAGVRQALNKA
jgi:hypothetical protein